MRWLLPVALSCLLTLGCQKAPPLARNERAFFPPQLAFLTKDASEWHVLLDGAVCKPSFLSRQLPVFGDWLDVEKVVTDEASRQVLRERLTPFISNHRDGRYLTVTIGDDVYTVGPTDKKGIIDQELPLGAVDVAGTVREAGGRSLPLRVRARSTQDRYTESTVRLIPERGLSIVSDIDDTIRVTESQNTKKMLKHTFIDSPYEAIPGMSELYRSWAAKYGAEFHYVSASSHWLYPPMIDLLQNEHFPPGTLHFRVTQETGLKAILSSLDPPPEYKVEGVSRLIDVLPHRRYVLVGDSGEHDPEAYAELARKYPSQVRLILIHNVTCEGHDSLRYQTTFAGVRPSLWQIYESPDQIRDAPGRATATDENQQDSK